MKLNPWLNAFFIALLLAIVTRNCIVEPFYVDSKVLEPNFQENELVWLNKLKFGARFPITPISFPFFKRKIPFTNVDSYSSFEISYFRFPGFSNITTRNFIVFNSPQQIKLPVDRREILMHKCYAIPGDTLELLDNNIFVNKRKDLEFSANSKKRIWLLSENLKKELSETKKTKNLTNLIGSYLLDSDSTLILKKEKDSLVKVYTIKPNSSAKLFFDKNKFFLGANFIVPKKNVEIHLNSKNFAYLRTVIEHYEDSEIRFNENKLFIDGVLTSKYRFKQNYYFVITKRSKNGLLKWLLVPENHIIGIF